MHGWLDHDEGGCCLSLRDFDCHTHRSLSHRRLAGGHIDTGKRVLKLPRRSERPIITEQILFLGTKYVNSRTLLRIPELLAVIMLRWHTDRVYVPNVPHMIYTTAENIVHWSSHILPTHYTQSVPRSTYRDRAWPLGVTKMALRGAALPMAPTRASGVITMSSNGSSSIQLWLDITMRENS